ncbi:MAG TPA: rRNA maturation RNase YbeY [Xanthobacteraceae bacterium]|jgi:probable rRNA maturation factor
MSSARDYQHMHVRSTRISRATTIDIVTRSRLWDTRRNSTAVLKRALRQAASAVALKGGELAVVLADDSTVRDLNRAWRRQDKSTNVLSFPADARPIPSATRALLGDIVIAYETTEREARALGKPFAHHLAHLAVHGFLHLLGYDHRAEHEAHAMEELEICILGRLGVPNPYC